jgi:hypothetical protein
MTPSDGYARWAREYPSAHLLREKDAPPEVLLQAVWQQQRLLRDRLTTLDGRPIRVLHPGFLNREAGPDFHAAFFQIGDEAPVSGDIEVDLEFSGWRSHGHDRNPTFKGVMLHVVWDGKGVPPKHGLPQLALKPFLDAPIEELAASLAGDTAQLLPEEMSGKCLAPLKELSGESVTVLLEQAALCRLEMKASQFNARARRAGWDRALWEGLFRALGYKLNAWPMQRLAELLPDLGFDPQGKPESAFVWQARLLGVSGLLPAELDHAAHDAGAYVRKLWDQWWRERDRLAEFVLPRSLWKMGGQRPANHPQRRLALAAHWLARPDLPTRLADWFSTPIAENQLAPSLLKILTPGRDDFWSRHRTLRSKPMDRPQPLLGATRVADIAVNAVLPWHWTRCVEGGDPRLQKTAETRFFAWPRAQDNAVLRLLARQRLLGGAHSRRLTGAAVQQGLMQIVRDFCSHSNAVCEDCRFPELVRSLNAAPGKD